jgi:cell division protein FtsI/penicillin-binding protein 2
VFLLVALGYVALAGRLAYIQIYEHAYYVKVAEELRERTRVLPAHRGEILDRNGTLLVRNEPAADIILDPNVWYVDLPASKASPATATNQKPSFLAAGILPGAPPPPAAGTGEPVLSAEARAMLETRRRATLDGLAKYLPDLDVTQIAARAAARNAVTGKHKTVDVRRKVDAATARAIREADLPGVGVLPATRRLAQNGSLAPQVVGYTDIDGRGLDGLEGASTTRFPARLA